jgi:hypothetical protein
LDEGLEINAWDGLVASFASSEVIELHLGKEDNTFSNAVCDGRTACASPDGIGLCINDGICRRSVCTRLLGCCHLR